MRHSRMLLAASAMLCALSGFSTAEANIANRREARGATPPRSTVAPARSIAATAPARSTAATAPARSTGPARSIAYSSSATRQVAGRSAARRGGGGGISCVPYARSASGIEVSGNGRDWWYNAAGLYARGQRPEPGSVMAFPGSGGMRMGHVAVVESVRSPRDITIHHANWGGPGIRRGSVMHGVSVVDVSEGNDWSAVRVQAGHDNSTFGRVYPTYGFIYNRPDPTGGTMLASNATRGRSVQVVEGGRSASLSDLRGRFDALAQAPSPHARQHLDLTRTGMSFGR